MHVPTPAWPGTQRRPSLEGSSGGDWGLGLAQVGTQGARQVPRVLLAGRGLSSRTSAMWPEGHQDPGEAASLLLSTLSLPGDSLSNWGLPQTLLWLLLGQPLGAGPGQLQLRRRNGRDEWAVSGAFGGQARAGALLCPCPASFAHLWGAQPLAREDERVWAGGPCDCSLQRLLPACSRSMASKEGGPSRRRRWWQRETSGNRHRY